MLNLAKNLKIPVEAVTRTFAILGIRGSGKTNTGVVLTEELFKAQQQVIVLDPVDVWWGLRSSADGKASGYPVTILGGEHADLPLESGTGGLIADFAVEQHASLVLSVRHLSIKEQRHFATDFAERLYARKGQQKFRQPLHLVVDECDEFIPQKIPTGGERMFGAFDRIVRRGRAGGMGVTMISQRAQVVNKDVLSQIETLVCHRVLHKLDRHALEAWIVAHDVHGRHEEFLQSLASLGRGEAWVWSPEWLDLFERVTIRPRETFDSSATPKAGDRPLAPKRMAEVDLTQLREQMATVLERAKEEDPRELKKRIAALEAELRKKAPAAPPDAAILDRVRNEAAQAADARIQLVWQAALKRTVADVTERLEALPLTLTWADPDSHTKTPPTRREPVPVPRPTGNGTEDLRRIRESAKSEEGGPSPAERKLLIALSQYPEGLTDSKLAILSGYAAGSGNYNKLIRSLRVREWAEGPISRLQITQAGFDALGTDYHPLPEGAALLEHWVRRLNTAEGKILRIVADVHPESLTEEQIAERAGYAGGSGNFNKAMRKLRMLNLLDGSRQARRASDALF